MFGQCCLRPLRKYILPDQAVLLNTKKLMEGDSDQPTLAVQAEQCEAVESLQKAWAPKGYRKAASFTGDQRKYLEEKFRISQETGHKADPEQVAREMRYVRNERGERRFKVDEFPGRGADPELLLQTSRQSSPCCRPRRRRRRNGCQQPSGRRGGGFLRCAQHHPGAMRTSARHSLRHVEALCDELVQQTQ